MNLLEEEEMSCSSANQRKESSTKRHQDLIHSLQQLGDYESLLTPPLPAAPLANLAAAKAMMLHSGLSVGSGYFEGMNLNDMPVNCGELISLLNFKKFQCADLVFVAPCGLTCIILLF